MFNEEFIRLELVKLFGEILDHFTVMRLMQGMSSNKKKKKKRAIHRIGYLITTKH